MQPARAAALLCLLCLSCARSAADGIEAPVRLPTDAHSLDVFPASQGGAPAAALTRAPRCAQFPPIGCTLGPPPGRLRGGALGALGNVTVSAPLECCARCAERFADAQAFFVCINRGGCSEARRHAHAPCWQHACARERKCIAALC
jgi:hypothetical protein